MAKIKIVALKTDNKFINILTTIKESSFDKRTKPISKTNGYKCSSGEIIIVHEGFLRLKKLSEFKANILTSKAVKIDNEIIFYNVENKPRESFLWQREDWNPDSYNQILSPFYSNCELLEYWNIDLNIKNDWLKLQLVDCENIKKIFGLDINRLIDRAGNVLHYIAINEISVSVIHQNNKFLTLGFQIKDDHKDNNYVCNIEVKSCDDLILKKSFFIHDRFVDFELQDADYNTIIEVYNLKNSKCVFRRNFVFFGGGNPRIHYIKKEISRKPNFYSIETSVAKSEIPETISSLEDVRTRWTSRLKQIDNSQFVRFDNKQDSFPYFSSLLKKASENKDMDRNLPEYIYLADPYLFCNVGLQDYISILNSVKNTEFRLIGCRESIPAHLKKYIEDNKYLFKNVKIKLICLKEKDKNGNFEYILDKNGNYKLDSNGNKIHRTKETFHDRWVATKNEEYGLTNSINNFIKGVSFFKSFEHYFDEAESLWELDMNDPDILIEEFLIS